VVDKVTLEQLFGEVHRVFLSNTQRNIKQLYFNCCIVFIVDFMCNKFIVNLQFVRLKNLKYEYKCF
jgi:hypothetical protein